MVRRPAVVLGLLFLAHAAGAQFIQLGNKLVGQGAVGSAAQGTSVAVSADGNTLIVGGPGDDGGVGAAWVFVRAGVVWVQQGDKLVGSGEVRPAAQGTSVAISADGSTAIVGGPNDSAGVGAVWVFTRSGGVWTQQGSKLVGTGAIGSPQQGWSVALSADGSTAIAGGPSDDCTPASIGSICVGAAWVFTRSGGVWTRQSSKLIGSAYVGYPQEGWSVALSADGNTAIVGGPSDAPTHTWLGNFVSGAAWMFTRSGGAWSQQGDKLDGADASYGWVGYSAGITADGNTAILGGAGDNIGVGAAFVLSRSGGAWTQQGSKLVGTNAVGQAKQGSSVSISADGDTAVVGGPGDNGSFPSSTGAAWVFTRSGGVWTQQGGKLVGADAQGSATQGTSVSVSADGSTVVVGGPGDDGGAGAVWVFSASAHVAWVPVVSHGRGLNGSEWRSDLGLLNVGTDTATVQGRFFGPDRVATGSTYVPAGTQSILTDVVAQLGATGSGALEILSDQPLKITSRTYSQIPSNAACLPDGTQGQDYPAVTAGDGLVAGQSAYLAGLVENASYRCNIGLVDTGPDPATVLVELFDGAGDKLAEYAVPLVSGQWAQATQPFLTKAAQTAMDRGYAKVTVQSGSGVFAFASLIDTLTNDPTTVAMQR